MNAARRKLIASCLEKLEAIKADLDTAHLEEQEYFDNMPESIQAGQKGDAASEAADALSDAASSVQDAIDGLQNLN